MAECAKNLKIILEGFIALKNEQDPERQKQLRACMKDAYFYLFDTAQGKLCISEGGIFTPEKFIKSILEILQDSILLKIAAELPVGVPNVAPLYEFKQGEIQYGAKDYDFIAHEYLDKFSAAKLSFECKNQIHYVKFTRNEKSYLQFKMVDSSDALRTLTFELKQEISDEALKEFIIDQMKEINRNYEDGYFDDFHRYCVTQFEVIHGIARGVFFEFLSQLAKDYDNIAEINDRLEKLVDNGIKKSALHYAVEFNDADLIGSLIAKGADVNERDVNGETPLHYAAKNNNPELVNLLIEKGADVRILNGNDKLAIDIADSNEVLKSLVEAGSKKSGISPISYAIQRGGKAFRRTLEIFYSQSKTKELLNEVVIYLELNKAINKVDSDGKTALHHAVEADNVELVKALIQKGADIDKADAEGRTPLHYAAESGNVESVRALIEKRADVNKVDAKEKTLLHDAAKSGNPKLIGLLIDEGLHVEEVDSEDKTPLHYAAASGNVESVHALIKAGANVHQADTTGKTPLHYAVVSGNVESVSALIQAGADINCADLSSGTPLHYTLQSKNGVETALLLLKAGADIYQQYPMKQSDGSNKLGPSVCAYSKRSLISKNTEAAALIQRYHTLSTIGNIALGLGCVVGMGLMVLAAAALLTAVVVATHGAVLAPLAVAAHACVPSGAISVGTGVDALATASALFASVILFKCLKKISETCEQRSQSFAARAIGTRFFNPSRKNPNDGRDPSHVSQPH